MKQFNKELTKDGLHSFDAALSGVMTESQEFNFSNSEAVTFDISKDLSSDYITIWAKVADSSDYIPLHLNEDNSTMIRIKDVYKVSLRGIVSILFTRTGITEGDLSVNVTIID